MSTEEHKALIRRLIEEVWNQGHLAVHTGAKYDQVSQKVAGWLKFALLSVTEYRELFARAGYTDIQKQGKIYTTQIPSASVVCLNLSEAWS